MVTHHQAAVLFTLTGSTADYNGTHSGVWKEVELVVCIQFAFPCHPLSTQPPIPPF